MICDCELKRIFATNPYLYSQFNDIETKIFLMSSLIRVSYYRGFFPRLIITRHCSQNIVQGPKKKTKTKQQRLHYNHEVITYVQRLSREKKKHEKDVLSDVRDNFMHYLLTNPAQITGFNLSEIQERVALFTSTGISTNDAVILSLNIPSCLLVVNKNFKKVLQRLQTGKLPVEKLIFNYPYLGSIDYRIVDKNLQLLEKEFQLVVPHNIQSDTATGSDPVSKLLLNCPMLLSYILNSHSVKLLNTTTFNLPHKNSIVENISLSMKEPAVSRKEIDEFVYNSSNEVVDNSPVIEFLTSYEVDLDAIAVTCPEFFLATKEIIDICVNNVSSEPFFFGAEDIEVLLSSYPDVFLSFYKDIVQEQAKFIAKVSTTKTRAYKILREYPELFRDPDKFFKRVKLFEKYGIKGGDIGRLLAQKGGTNCFIDSEDFTDDSLTTILKFYTTAKDIIPLQIVVAAPISLSRKSTNIIKARLSFMRHKQLVQNMTRKKKKNRSQITLQTIVRSSLKDFIENICTSNIEEYDIFCKENKLKNYKAEYKKTDS